MFVPSWQSFPCQGHPFSCGIGISESLAWCEAAVVGERIREGGRSKQVSNRGLLLGNTGAVIPWEPGLSSGLVIMDANWVWDSAFPGHRHSRWKQSTASPCKAHSETSVAELYWKENKSLKAPHPLRVCLVDVVPTRPVLALAPKPGSACDQHRIYTSAEAVQE